MARIDLVCRSCKHGYQVESETMLKDDEKNCPACGSDAYRQTFASFRWNGPLVDPKWANLGSDGCSRFG